MTHTHAHDPTDFAAYEIAAVIPAYNELPKIAAVLDSLPDFLRWIIVVDDYSRDETADIVLRAAVDDPRIVLIRHEQNRGVGGAMVSGFEKAIQLDAQVVVKFDGDGQMSPDNLAELLTPLVLGQADYAKGNRFHDFDALLQMPLVRRFGNTVLSFLTKAAVGYWNLFDPCNGYVAIRGDILKRLPLHKISHSFFFETSMLSRLYLLGAVVHDVPMPARYANEISHLSIPRVIVDFLPRLARCFGRRILLKNFLFDFSMESVFLTIGAPMLLSGLVFGLTRWRHYAQLGQPSPTGTVVISALLVILGFQLLLSAVSEDLRSVPTTPWCNGPLLPRRRAAGEPSNTGARRAINLPPR